MNLCISMNFFHLLEKISACYKKKTRKFSFSRNAKNKCVTQLKFICLCSMKISLSLTFICDSRRRRKKWRKVCIFVGPLESSNSIHQYTHTRTSSRTTKKNIERKSYVTQSSMNLQCCAYHKNFMLFFFREDSILHHERVSSPKSILMIIWKAFPRLRTVASVCENESIRIAILCRSNKQHFLWDRECALYYFFLFVILGGMTHISMPTGYSQISPFIVYHF